MSLDLKLVGENDLDLNITITSSDTSLATTHPEYWPRDNLTLTPADLKIEVTGDLPSYKTSFTFDALNITRVQNSMVSVSIPLRIENTLQGEEVVKVDLDPTGPLATTAFFVSLAAKSVTLQAQDNPVLFND